MKAETDATLSTVAETLQLRCGECRACDTVLVVSETEEGGFYDPALAPLIQRYARELGFDAQMLGLPFCREVRDPDPNLVARIRDPGTHVGQSQDGRLAGPA